MHDYYLHFSIEQLVKEVLSSSIVLPQPSTLKVYLPSLTKLSMKLAGWYYPSSVLLHWKITIL